MGLIPVCFRRPLLVCPAGRFLILAPPSSPALPVVRFHPPKRDPKLPVSYDSVGILRLQEFQKLLRGRHLRARWPEVIYVPRADHVASMFGSRLADDPILEVLIFEVFVSPDGSNSPGV